MLIAPFPPFAAVIRRGGLHASLFATVDHDAAPGSLGLIGVSGARGAITLVGGDITGAAGDEGGLFSAITSGGGVEIVFDRDGLGDGFTEGQSALTRLSIEVTDGVTVTTARIGVTVRRPLAPPALLGPIPDQMDFLP
ncbi:hypothetical protein G5B40_10635 [Pikeienuella piscinae]|uniref:Uncharacterized protein n=1 Tax=Pikeienuella piscinae TaxID=2748098 RepID=A0A7L5BXJ4_9RHOB|nr:hypothetical protein [Pikeienuella piscinae]QIE55863.1 hypothetical protein G5B40_10635 [Pikeienuella piscinae]